MIKRTKIEVPPICHPHFVEDVGNSKVVRSDAPAIRSEIDPNMFSLGVNKINKQNLQPVQTELSNRIDAMLYLASESAKLESSIQDYQKEQDIKASAAKFQKMMSDENSVSNES